MPVKARYWKNPAHHLKEVHDRRARLIALGLSIFLSLSPAAQVRSLIRRNNWRKAHLKNNRASCVKYRKKLIRLFGTCSPRAVWQHTMLKTTLDNKLRKLRAKTYERK